MECDIANKYYYYTHFYCIILLHLATVLYTVTLLYTIYCLVVIYTDIVLHIVLCNKEIIHKVKHTDFKT